MSKELKIKEVWADEGWRDSLIPLKRESGTVMYDHDPIEDPKMPSTIVITLNLQTQSRTVKIIETPVDTGVEWLTSIETEHPHLVEWSKVDK